MAASADAFPLTGGSFLSFDVGLTGIDAGQSAIDAGSNAIDEEKSVIDEGQSVIDAGQSVIDEGRSAIDEEKSVIDAGRSVIDDTFFLIVNPFTMTGEAQSGGDRATGVASGRRSTALGGASVSVNRPAGNSRRGGGISADFPVSDPKSFVRSGIRRAGRPSTLWMTHVWEVLTHPPIKICQYLPLEGARG